MGTRPGFAVERSPRIGLLADGPVVLACRRCLMQYVGLQTRLGVIQVGGARHVRFGSRHVRVEISEVRKTQRLRWHVGADNRVGCQRRHGVDNRSWAPGDGRWLRNLGRFPFADFVGSRTLFAGHIFLCETLLLSLVLPVVISHTSTVHDDACAELPEHRPGGDDGDLSRPIRVRKDFLVDQLVLLRLGRDDFKQGPVLVE